MDDLFRLAVEACPAAMIMVDRDGRILLANAECERMFGYEPDRLVGMSVDTLVPLSTREGHAARRSTFATAPSKRRMGEGRDLRATRADGSEFPVEIGLTPVAGLGVLAFVIDITARLEAECSIRDALAEVERANESLGRFAYVAAHDIQEPLRKIAVYADVLMSAIETEDMIEASHAAEVMRGAARHARRLVQDVLALAKATDAALDRRPVSVRAIVDDVLDRLSQTIVEERAVLSVEVAEVTLDCDHQQAVRLLQNLVSNALKYHKPDVPPVVRISVDTDAEGAAHLVVADEGVGFAPHHAREIFQPFKRLHGRATFSGSGIGLAICKSIADRHGWTIAVDAAEGIGVTFDVRCPPA